MLHGNEHSNPARHAVSDGSNVRLYVALAQQPRRRLAHTPGRRRRPPNHPSALHAVGVEWEGAARRRYRPNLYAAESASGSSESALSSVYSERKGVCAVAYPDVSNKLGVVDRTLAWGGHGWSTRGPIVAPWVCWGNASKREHLRELHGGLLQAFYQRSCLQGRIGLVGRSCARRKRMRTLSLSSSHGTVASAFNARSKRCDTSSLSSAFGVSTGTTSKCPSYPAPARETSANITRRSADGPQSRPSRHFLPSSPARPPC